MPLLSMIQAAMLRQNMAKPSNAFANSDTGVQQRIALLQDVGDELAERDDWQALNIAATIVADGVTTLFTFPAGFGGMSNGLQFQSTLYPMLPVYGPVTNEQMAALKAFPVAPIQCVWRPIGGQFEFFPAPALGEVFTYNYYSSFWIKSATGTLQSAWQADSDVSLIDEKVLTTGLEWRWLQAKGLDYAEAFRRYEMRLARADGRQDAGREVQMSRKVVLADGMWPGLIPINSDATTGAGSGFDAGFDSGFT